MSKKIKITNDLNDNHQQENSKDQDNNNLNQTGKQKEKVKQKGKETKEKKITPKHDTFKDFNWFKSYPITPIMQQHNKLNTLLAL